ncbi:MAG TPA: matrixin family metalloprotease [Pyrinomonadaceae bacterium]|jgi:predicted Zn-dependent protease
MRRFLKIYCTIFLLIAFALSASGYAPQYSEEKTDLKLRWNAGTIPISISDSLYELNPNIKADSDISGAVRRSLQSWEKVTNINFKETASEKKSVSPSGNFGDGVSLITIAHTPENILLFSGEAESVSAITRVFFNKKGVITEADIVLNPYQQFSTDGTVGTFDLESTLTHEIGHLLGLEHSSVLGATMHESSGKNGVFNLSSYDSRTLAETDITAIRAIYGLKEEDENCCGAISGKLLLSDGKTAKNYKLWAEEFETGKVSAEYTTNADGGFHFESLPVGKYKVYAQNLSKTKGFKSAEEVGVAEVGKGKTAGITKKLDQTLINFQVQYVGFNGQLSENSVTLNAGKSYTVYVGGKNININDYKIGFSSPLMTVTPNTLFEHDFGGNISVLSFEVNVKPEIALGEYNIYLESEKGQKSYVLGGLTIEEFENPWSNYSLANNQ